jgi:UrcA family protein
MPTSTPNRMLRTFARGAVVLTAAMLGTVAVAQSPIDVSGRSTPGSETRSKVLRISDLNLASPQGQRRLDQRLRYTVSYVCNSSVMYGTRAPRDYVRCYSEALSGARGMIAQRVASGDTSAIRVATR